MASSSRSASNHFFTRYSEMILSSERILNINHLVTNEIKSVLRTVSTLETKWDVSEYILHLGTLYCSHAGEMKMIHESEAKRHYGTSKVI